jgi:hypothetical protein
MKSKRLLVTGKQPFGEATVSNGPAPLHFVLDFASS